MKDELSRYGPELLRGNTDWLLLSLIRESAKYGYQLIKEMQARSGGYFRFKEGTLYPALHRLEAEGLIEGAWQDVHSGQERRYYTITPKGASVLQQKIADWRDFASAVNMIFRPEGAQAV